MLCACARLSGVHRASLLVKSAKTNSSVYAHGNGTETPRGGVSVHLLGLGGREGGIPGSGVYLREQRSYSIL